MLGTPASAAAGAIRAATAQLDGPMPIGDVLERRMITACLRHDQAQLRQILMSYAAWLGELVDPARPEGCFAGASNVIATTGAS